uniref:Alpha-carbonic anhydrase domain-containing protein n=1 Tax=Ascaris lumbricoides TaxID=6252 RepID=A0A9J2PJJ5_ASCLU
MFYLAGEQCDGGRLKSPCVIDGNDATYVDDKKVAFYVNGITGELHNLILNLHFSEGQLYFTGFSGTDTIPHVQYNGLIHRLSKIWFRFQYRMAGSEHRYVNDRILEENIGEIYMDFKQCTQENKTHHVIFASVLKQSPPTATDFHEYDDLFDRHRILRDSKYNEMQVNTKLSWDLFLPRDRRSAWAYNGSLPDGTCDGGVLYVIFKAPIFAKVKGNLLSYYSLSVQMARPIQGIPNKLYKYSSHHFDFGYRLSKKDIESCIAAMAAAKQTLEETTTRRTKTSTGDRFTQISTYLKSSY